MILLALNTDLTIQWICVGVIVVIAIFWVIKRVRLSLKNRGGSGCGCGRSDDSVPHGGASGDPCDCDTQDSSRYSGSCSPCSGCPLADNCKKPKS